MYGNSCRPLSGLVPAWPVIHSVRDFMTTACGFVTSMAGDSFLYGISCRPHVASYPVWPVIHFTWDFMPTSCCFVANMALVPSMAGDLLCMGFHAGLMRYCAQCGRRFTLYGIPCRPLSGLVPVGPVIHFVRDFMTTACGFVT